jgi:DNA-binding NtrC family response regulator
MGVKKGRLLIVDDETDITNSFSLALENYLSRSIQRLSNALSNFKANSYDPVLLDIRMPVMNGFVLYKNIKAIDGWAKVCFLAGVNDFLIQEELS